MGCTVVWEAGGDGDSWEQTDHVKRTTVDRPSAVSEKGVYSSSPAHGDRT